MWIQRISKWSYPILRSYNVYHCRACIKKRTVYIASPFCNLITITEIHWCDVFTKGLFFSSSLYSIYLLHVVVVHSCISSLGERKGADEWFTPIPSLLHLLHCISIRQTQCSFSINVMRCNRVVALFQKSLTHIVLSKVVAPLYIQPTMERSQIERLVVTICGNNGCYKHSHTLRNWTSYLHQLLPAMPHVRLGRAWALLMCKYHKWTWAHCHRSSLISCSNTS